MMDGFDLNSPLVCEGIIGDGCGGGRIFFIEDGLLQAYDPQSKNSIILLKNIKDAISISKKVCIISIKCKSEIIKIDLSKINS